MRFSSSKFAGILFIIAAGVLAAIPRLSGKAVMAQTASSHLRPSVTWTRSWTRISAPA